MVSTAKKTSQAFFVLFHAHDSKILVVFGYLSMLNPVDPTVMLDTWGVKAGRI
jgi:hypothetical protein